MCRPDSRASAGAGMCARLKLKGSHWLHGELHKSSHQYNWYYCLNKNWHCMRKFNNRLNLSECWRNLCMIKMRPNSSLCFCEQGITGLDNIVFLVPFSLRFLPDIHWAVSSKWVWVAIVSFSPTFATIKLFRHCNQSNASFISEKQCPSMFNSSTALLRLWNQNVWAD